MILQPFQAILFDLDGVLVDSEELANGVWVELLAEHGLTLRGPPPGWLDVPGIDGWAAEAFGALRDSAGTVEVDEAVLGACRLHYLLALRRIPSKSEAGLYGLIALDERWRRIIDEALRLRRTPDGPALYLDEGERRRHALAFVEAAAEDGLSLP